MEDRTEKRQEHERQIEGVLLSDDTPIGKVQRIVQLGVEQETADELVDHYQFGQTTPVYYERIDYDSDLELD